MDIPVNYAAEHQGFPILECAQDANYKNEKHLDETGMDRQRFPNKK